MGSGARERWAGLVVDGDRLWLRGSRLSFVQFRLEPDGLALVFRRGEEMLAWSDAISPVPANSRWWRIIACAPSRTNRAAVIVEIEREPGSARRTFEFPQWIERQCTSPLVTWRFAFQEFSALVEYLVETPEARQGLTDETRLRSLLGAMSERPLFDWGASRGKFELRRAVDTVLAKAWPRRFEGHPVRGEPHPDAGDLVPIVRLRLPRWVRARFTDEEIAARLERHLAMWPWPFDCLLAAPPTLAAEQHPAAVVAQSRDRGHGTPEEAALAEYSAVVRAHVVSVITIDDDHVDVVVDTEPSHPMTNHCERVDRQWFWRGDIVS